MRAPRTGVAAAALVSAAALIASASPALARPALASAPVASPAATGRGSTCPLPTFGPGSDYHPRINPLAFSPDVTNPLYPLHVGRTLIYTGTTDGVPVLNIVTTTARTARIDGVDTRVVEDRIYLNNVLHEHTSDYFAQDRCGNVWYFGEDTATLDARGNVVSTDGTFHAGVDGAEPGVFMQAHPQVGRTFRQEWYRGQAEDVFRVTGLDVSISTPYGTFGHAVRSVESTRLEPSVVGSKVYVRGIGQVAELSVRGEREFLRLVEIIS